MLDNNDIESKNLWLGCRVLPPFYKREPFSALSFALSLLRSLSLCSPCGVTDGGALSIFKPAQANKKSYMRRRRSRRAHTRTHTHAHTRAHTLRGVLSQIPRPAKPGVVPRCASPPKGLYRISCLFTISRIVSYVTSIFFKSANVF